MKEFYPIILMDYDGNIVREYDTCIIPMVGDVIMIDDETPFNVEKRHFSTNNIKTVLLGKIEEDE